MDAQTPAYKAIKKRIDEAKQTGQIDQDSRLTIYTSSSNELDVYGDKLADVLKVASDFYLAKHCPQYSVDFKKIIETGVDDRTVNTVETGSWAERTQGGNSQAKDSPSR